MHIVHMVLCIYIDTYTFTCMWAGDGQGSLVCCSPWGRRVGHDWATEHWTYITLGFPHGSVVKNLPAVQELQEMQIWSLGRKIPWRRAWQPTPVFLPGESHGERNLVGNSPWDLRVGHNWCDLACMHTHITLSSELFLRYGSMAKYIHNHCHRKSPSYKTETLYPWNP